MQGKGIATRSPACQSASREPQHTPCPAPCALAEAGLGRGALQAHTSEQPACHCLQRDPLWLTRLPQLPQYEGSAPPASVWLNTWLLKLHLPGSQPHVPLSPGAKAPRCTQPVAPSLHGFLLLSIPAFQHLQVHSILVFSKLVLLPPFMFLLLSCPLVVGNPYETLHQSTFSFQLPRCPPACAPTCFTFASPSSFPACS